MKVRGELVDARERVWTSPASTHTVGADELWCLREMVGLGVCDVVRRWSG